MDQNAANDSNVKTLGFPSRFSALPNIGESYDQGFVGPGKELVPFNNYGLPMDSTRALETERELVRAIETRLEVTEKSNRALLGEVIRLQNEVKSLGRRQDDASREEKKMQSQMESTLRTSRDVLAQMNRRLADAEQKLESEQRTVDNLLEEAKGIESMFRTYTRANEDTKLTNSDRYLSTTRVNALVKDVEDMTQSRNQLERIAFQLVDEIKTLKSQLEAQGFDISTVTEDMKFKSKRMAEEYMQNLEAIRRQIDRQSNEDIVSSQRYANLETKVKDIRDVVSDLQRQQQDEVTNLRKAEDGLFRRISELNNQYIDLTRKQDEVFRQLDNGFREKDRKLETDKMDLEHRVREIVDEVNNRMHQREIKSNDEQIRKFSELEKILRIEQDTRERHEREIKFEFERRFDSANKIINDDLFLFRDQIKTDRLNVADIAKRLDEAIGLTEKQMSEMKKEVWNVLTAEIQTRTTHDDNYSSRLREVESKIQAATAAMQQAIGGVAQNLNSHSETAVQKMERSIEDNRKDLMRHVSDLEAQVLNLQKRLNSADERLEARMSKALSAMSTHVRDKIDSLSLWQSSINSTVDALKRQQQSAYDDIKGLTEKLELLQSEVKSRVSAETDARIAEAELLRRDIDDLKSHPFDKYAQKTELEQCQNGIRRLAESMQTVKTILGMKIQSEQKLRLEEMKKLQHEVVSLRHLVEPLLQKSLQPRVFIKPDNSDMVNRDVVEIGAPDINKWSMYSAYRWLNWKSKLMYIKWSLSNRKPPATPKKPGPDPVPEHPWDDGADDEEDDDDDEDEEEQQDKGETNRALNDY